MYACLSVCLSVCLSARLHISKSTQPNFTTFYVHVTCDLSLVLLWRRSDTLYTSGFVDDVIFSLNGENKPESTTTRMFRRVRQVTAPAAKSAVSDCILFRATDIIYELNIVICSLKGVNGATYVGELRVLGRVGLGVVWRGADRRRRRLTGGAIACHRPRQSDELAQTW